MRARIASHRADRGDLWTTHEEPLDLVGRLAAIDLREPCDPCRLPDAMGYQSDDGGAGSSPPNSPPLPIICQARERCIVLVSNEVGLGIVPENRMARDFRDHAGRLHQLVAATAAKSISWRPDCRSK